MLDKNCIQAPSVSSQPILPMKPSELCRANSSSGLREITRQQHTGSASIGHTKSSSANTKVVSVQSQEQLGLYTLSASIYSALSMRRHCWTTSSSQCRRSCKDIVAYSSQLPSCTIHHRGRPKKSSSA